MKNLVNENAVAKLNQEEYIRKYDSLNLRYNKANELLEKFQAERKSKVGQDKAIAFYIKTLKKNSTLLEEWDDRIWITMVEKAVVHKNNSITFHFLSGEELEVEEKSSVFCF